MTSEYPRIPQQAGAELQIVNAWLETLRSSGELVNLEELLEICKGNRYLLTTVLSSLKKEGHIREDEFLAIVDGGEVWEKRYSIV